MESSGSSARGVLSKENEDEFKCLLPPKLPHLIAACRKATPVSLSDIVSLVLLLYHGFHSDHYEIKLISCLAGVFILLRASIRLLGCISHGWKCWTLYTYATTICLVAVLALCSGAAYFRERWTFGVGLVALLLQVESCWICFQGATKPAGTYRCTCCESTQATDKTSCNETTLDWTTQTEHHILVSNHFYVDEDDDVIYAAFNIEEVDPGTEAFNKVGSFDGEPISNKVVTFDRTASHVSGAGFEPPQEERVFTSIFK